LTNAIELDLPSMIKIHLVVNVSRVHRYKDQVEGQKKEQLVPVVIERKEEYEVEKILNKKRFREKDLSQTSFGHISTKPSTIPTVLKPA